LIVEFAGGFAPAFGLGSVEALLDEVGSRFGRVGVLVLGAEEDGVGAVRAD